MWKRETENDSLLFLQQEKRLDAQRKEPYQPQAKQNIHQRQNYFQPFPSFSFVTTFSHYKCTYEEEVW